MILDAQKIELPEAPKCELFIAALGGEAQARAFQMVTELQTYSIFADCDNCSRSLKAQMKYADKIGAKYTLVLGGDELEQGQASLKNMSTKEQETVNINDDFPGQFLAATAKMEGFGAGGGIGG